MTLYNSHGAEVSGFPVLRKSAYGTGGFYAGDARRPIPDYEKWLVHADENGFDTTKESAPGQYIVKLSLPRGTHIIRYGNPLGRFSAPKGTVFEELSLPWREESCEYHEYVVAQPTLEVVCIVTKGYTAPGFEYVGGGVQFYHEKRIKQSVEENVLKEVSKPWLRSASQT